MKNNISRKDALKRMGGLALGLPLAPSALSNISFSGVKHAPNIMVPQKRIKGKPNVLWITTEGVPVSVLSCYGGRYSSFLQTPNIDRIANEGMMFNNSFCNNALCAPSRATLLTGKYNHLAGSASNGYNADPSKPYAFFDPQQETFPKLLQKAGYQTGMVGKWHMKKSRGETANPGIAGFDYFSFKKGAGGPYYNPDGFIENPSMGSKEMVHRSRPGYITDTFTDLAIKGMKQFKQPFFMMMDFFSDHRPFDPPHKYEHIFDDIHFPEPGTFYDNYKNRSSVARDAHMRISDMKDFNPPEDYTKKQLQQWNYQQLIRHFLGTLKSQDDNVGRLLDFLDESGLADNTIVVFTGDHGFFLGEHGWFDKRFMYEPSLRVPWMVRYPGVTNAGSKTDAWVQSIDNAPTIMDMLGLPVPDDMQGRSLMPVFKENTPKDWPKSMYYHYYEEGPPHFVLPNYGVRTERYKLIYYYTVNQWELFDLKRDPDEMDSLFYERGMKVKEGYEDILEDLLTQLKKLRKKFKDDTGKPVNFRPRKAYN
ncbi:MAG TPA: sulfatase [Chitinophagaceae bacterium]|nr:sulfatase [Chitinophagaceae bacterium]